MRTIPSLFAFAAFCLLLLGWRTFYPVEGRASAGLTCLTALALLSLFGSYRVALARRKAILSASLESSSGLKRILTGRLGAAFRALAGTAAVVPVVAYTSLMASQAEIYLVAAAAAWVVAMALALDRVLSHHLRPAYRISLVAPAAILVAALPIVAVAVWFSYSVLPIPDFARAPELSDALRQAVADLPRNHLLMFEIFSALRSADATIYWVLARDGFQSALPLVLFLLKGAVSYLSITKVAVDCQAAFHGRIFS